MSESAPCPNCRFPVAPEGSDVADPLRCGRCGTVFPRPEPAVPAATRLQGWLVRIRSSLLALYVGAFLCGLPLLVVWVNLDSRFYLPLGIGIGLFVLTQAAFLSGSPSLRLRAGRHHRPAWLSIAVGGFIGALLTAGLGLALVSLYDLAWDSLQGPEMAAAVNGLIVVALAAWLFWCVAFTVMWLRRGSATFQRLYIAIFAGSALELVVTIPIDVQVRSQRGCYCEQPSLFALIIGVTVMLWAFGPGIVMLYLTKLEERREEQMRCRECGTDLRGSTDVLRCSVCATPLTPAQRRALGRDAGEREP